MQIFQTYYKLTKPGIIYGNAITTIAGFLFASKINIHIFLLFQTVLATSLIIASACVYNNYLDRTIDKKMSRTKNRALVIGIISPTHALIFATLLGLSGFILLIHTTNPVTVTLGIIAFVDYIIFYGISKRKSVFGTIVGSISGALPPVAGYTAITNHLDLAASLLFFFMVFWQMPHFYAIAIFRLKDYTQAHIPVLPIKQGIKTTKIHILIYIFACLITTILFSFFQYTKYTFSITMLLMGLYWLYLALKGFKTTDDTLWAKKVFGFSLIYLLGFSLLLSLTLVLP